MIPLPTDLPPVAPAAAAVAAPGPAQKRSDSGRGRRDVSDAVVVITGAASGIGLCTAQAFAHAGARVALLDLDAQRAAEEADKLTADGRRALAVTCDVASETSCAAALEQVRATWGDVSVLVCNAGISHRSLFADTTVDVLRRVMDVNFFGAVHCTSAALPMLRRTRGAIVAVTSVAGFAPLVGRTGYAASKHALHGFFDSLRTEVAHEGVDVTIVCPSYTRTAIDRNALSGQGRSAEQPRATTGGLASPESIARAILDGVVDRAPRVLPTWLSRSAWWLSRLAPATYARIMLAKHRDEFALTTTLPTINQIGQGTVASSVKP